MPLSNKLYQNADTDEPWSVIKTSMFSTFCTRVKSEIILCWSGVDQVEENIFYLYMAAQAHRCGDHGEVNALDLTECRSVAWIRNGVTGPSWNGNSVKCFFIYKYLFHPTKRTQYFSSLLTLYEPMALICVTMVRLTLSHRTPNNLGTE